jgi:hypothetical protein
MMMCAPVITDFLSVPVFYFLLLLSAK